VKYGFGVLATTLQFALQRIGLAHCRASATKGANWKRAAKATTQPARKPCATVKTNRNGDANVVEVIFDGVVA
jgi:hypothetical protein